MDKDYYRILGVADDAEDIVIRAAYKALAQRYHPDKYYGSKEDAERIIKDINDAYNVLSNTKKRNEYDSGRKSHGHKKEDDWAANVSPTSSTKNSKEVNSKQIRFSSVAFAVVILGVIASVLISTREVTVEQPSSNKLSVEKITIPTSRVENDAKWLANKIADATFPQSNITMVIPYGPGGGFDTTVRVFAPFFAKHLGGNVTIIPENIPGTGGRRGSTTVYRAKPDGYTLGIFNLPALVLPSVLGEKVDYELRELSWIGRIESQDYVLLVPASSSINTLQDLQAQEKIRFVSIGYGTTVLAAIQIVAEQLGLMAKEPVFLTGYSGTMDQLVALVRGDGNATISLISTAMQYIQSDSLRPLAVSGDARSHYLPDVATFTELGYPELAPLNVQRSIAAPPGVDPALLAQLRQAFSMAMTDPEFISAATKAQMDVAPLDGDQAAEAIQDNFTYYEKFKRVIIYPQ